MEDRPPPTDGERQSRGEPHRTAAQALGEIKLRRTLWLNADEIAPVRTRAQLARLQAHAHDAQAFMRELHRLQRTFKQQPACAIDRGKPRGNFIQTAGARGAERPRGAPSTARSTGPPGAEVLGESWRLPPEFARRRSLGPSLRADRPKYSDAHH